MLGRPAEGPRAPVDIAELLQRLLATDVPAAVDSTIVVSAANTFVLADYNALIQVFRNLVRNALEAMDSTQRPAALRVSVADDREHADWLRVIVADNGRGLGDGPWDRLFEPDFTSKAGGTGLGLAVARQTILAHGGAIAARHRAGGGAEFIVRLPRLAQETIS
jgi:signal transduction histidine kinase